MKPTLRERQKLNVKQLTTSIILYDFEKDLIKPFLLLGW